MDKLFERFEALFTEFTARRLMFWVVLIVGALLIGAVVESTTGLRFLWSMDRKVSLLKQLNDLAKDGVSQRPELAPIYTETVRQVDDYKVEPLTLSLEIDGEGLVKFGGAILPWLLLVLVFAVQKNKTANSLPGIVGALILGLVFGVVGLLVPTLGNPWLNVVIYFVFSLVIFLLVARMGSTKPARV